MPYQTKWLPKGPYKRFSGHVTAQEFFASMAELHNHPDFDRFAFSVNNFLDVISYDVPDDEVHTFAALGLGAQVSNPRMVIAIVARDEKILALVREKYEPVAEYKMGYFDCDADAAHWIEQVTGQRLAL